MSTSQSQKILPNASIQMNKSNVTLWKNQNTTSKSVEESKKVESEFIENLKKQIYFMEMELNLMKEREHEIQKSGGFTQLFNDERDPSQHILQLKTKYANMRKKMENNIEDLTSNCREVSGTNVSLKAKLETLKKLEKEAYMKLTNYEEKMNEKLKNQNAAFSNKNQERIELEANNRQQSINLSAEQQRNIDLEYSILSTAKSDEMKQGNFEKDMELEDNLIKGKIKVYEEINNKIKETDSKATEEPYFKTELEKNLGYKKKMEELEKEILQLNTQVEGMELVNDHLIRKKGIVQTERKKYVDLNVELRHEIDAKNQLNETRIQKKVRDSNSEEIQKLKAHLAETENKIKDLEDKLGKEEEKVKVFSLEIIKSNIIIRHKEETRNKLTEFIDLKLKDVSELKEKVDELTKMNNELKDKIAKEKTDNELIRNRHKLLAEEFSGVNSKYQFITKNYDFTTNLKKISMEDLKVLTQTNTLVNSTINSFVDKVGTFKKQNIQNMLGIDEE